MFDDKPIKIKIFWGVNRESETYTQPKPARPLHDWYFPEITFENSPKKIKIEITEE
jgi:hypothetical protein